ncbi:MAG: GTP 3',8-cyclase MoaA [Hyphomonadaceae bacterium]|nr:GTP 3',8-cyclase MoaA [Hyphomonadaceae bacterium]
MPDGLAPTRAPLVDQFGRHVTYLRLSVTDRCDLRCTYCMSEIMQFLPKRELLSIEELDQVARAFIQRGVKKIRVTGGEPLVRKGMPELFTRLGAYLGKGLDELTLTTNATQLEQHAEMLARSGVKRINVSLDTLDPDSFERITRRGKLDQVLAGIDAALDAGLKIKINTVALKHENMHDLADMIAWAHNRGMDMTLIEVMPLGETGEDRIDQYVPLPMVRDALEQEWTLTDVSASIPNGGPSRYVRVEQTGGRLGFITPLTNNFCAGCNRVRVTCTGRIYMCLGQDDHIDLRAALRESDHPDDALNACLDRALFKKPERHEFSIHERGQDPSLERHMSVTGG